MEMGGACAEQKRSISQDGGWSCSRNICICISSLLYTGCWRIVGILVTL